MRFVSIDPGRRTGWASWADGRLVGCGEGDPPPPFVWPEMAVIERPQVYPRSPVPPNDVVALAITAGRLSASYDEVRWVLPRQWKGQVPKHVHHPRILGKLDSHERRLVEGAGPDVLDAVGLGLWHLGR